MVRDSALLDIIDLAVAVVEHASADEWLLAAIFVALAGSMMFHIVKLAWAFAKRRSRRLMSFLWREFLDWLADRVFAGIMAALIALIALWSGGFWG